MPNLRTVQHTKAENERQDNSVYPKEEAASYFQLPVLTEYKPRGDNHKMKTTKQTKVKEQPKGDNAENKESTNKELGTPDRDLSEIKIKLRRTLTKNRR